MTEPSVHIHFAGHRRLYQPGELLEGEYHLESLSLAEPKAVEVSVLWHTEGQGDEDLAVHFFQRREAATTPSVDLHRPQRFDTRLPNSPLTYEGVIVKIRWCVRVRLFLQRGREIIAERPFTLGSVPPAVMLLPTGPTEPT